MKKHHVETLISAQDVQSRIAEVAKEISHHYHHSNCENLVVIGLLDGDIGGKDVLIVEDIIDTGFTLNKVREILRLREPRSVAICTLLDKPSRREVDVPVEWVGFAIPDEFVVGYGIDYAQRYRNLDYIGKVVMDE